MWSRVYEIVWCPSVCPIRLLQQCAAGLLLWAHHPVGDIDWLLHCWHLSTTRLQHGQQMLIVLVLMFFMWHFNNYVLSSMLDYWYWPHSVWNGIYVTVLSVCLFHSPTTCRWCGFAAMRHEILLVLLPTGAQQQPCHSIVCCSKCSQCHIVSWHRKLNTDLFN